MVTNIYLKLLAQCQIHAAAAAAAAAAFLQSCPTLCNPIDGSPPGSPVPGILQARTLEWGAISFSIGDIKNAHQFNQGCKMLTLRQNLFHYNS